MHDGLNFNLQPVAWSNTSIVADVQIAVANASYGFEQVPKALRKLLEQEAWRRFQLPDVSALPEEGDAADAEIEYAAEEFEIFCSALPPHGLGISVERLMHLTAAIDGEDAEVALQILRELLAPLQPHGGQSREDSARSEVGSRPRIPRGAGYQLRRLKRDHPAVAAEVVAGKLSPNAAAVRAGLQRRYLKIPANPWFAAEKLHAQGVEWISEMTRALEARTAEKRQCAESEGKPANSQAGADRGQIELPLTDRNHQPTISLQLPGEWLEPPGDPAFVSSLGAEPPTNASVSVARLKSGGFLAYVRAARSGDGYCTMALVFGDPAELALQNLPLDLVNTIETLIRGRWSAKSICRSASTSRSRWPQDDVPEAAG